MNQLKHVISRHLLLCAITGLSSVVHAAPALVCLIQPSKTAEVGSSVTGVIEALRVERGDTVKKGQVIAVLRNEVERAALSVAQSRAQADADVQAAMAGLEFARQSTARGEDLIKKKFISEQALDKTRTEERVAVQKLAQAREQRSIWDREKGLAQSQLAQRTIVSPISGIVAERYLSTGERVEDRSIARIVSIDPLHVEVMVPAASFGKIKAGMTATVTPELTDALPVEARVNLVDRLIDGASNTFRVRLTLPNPDHAIPAGPRCKVSFNDPQIDPKTLSNQPVSLSTTPPKPARVADKASARSAPLSTATADAQSDILNALEAWRAAWESKSLSDYVSAYASDFKGDRATRSDWLKQRETRIIKPGKLVIQITHAEVKTQPNNQAWINFRQTYQSDHLRTETPKSILMELDRGKWLIQEERVTPM